MKIENFRFLSPLWLYRGADASKLAPPGVDPMYAVGARFTVGFDRDGHPHLLTVPKGLLTDLTSSPWFARSIVGKVGRHLEAAIVHDFLYGSTQGLLANSQNRAFADALFNAGMKASEVPRWRRWLAYRTVRAFGGKSFREGRNLIVEIPERS